MKYTLIAFVPVLHAGYLELFKKYPETLQLIGPNFFSDFPRLERDIRALSPGDMKASIEALKIFSSVSVLDEKNLKLLLKEKGMIVMPDEAESRVFAEKHLKKKKIIFENVFLRWNRKISDQEYVVSPDRKISKSIFDRKVMGEVRQEASKSSDWWRQNGAVLVAGKKSVLAGYNGHKPTDYHVGTFGDPRSSFDAGERPDVYTTIHAEATVIARAAEKGLKTRGMSLYCTTFPCSNCARLMIEAGIKKVYYEKGYSRLDAEPIFKASGVEIILVQ